MKKGEKTLLVRRNWLKRPTVDKHVLDT